MKILYLSQHFPPETGAAQGRAYDMSKNLVDKGNQITMITAFPNYPIGKIYPGYENKFFLNEEVAGIKVRRSFITVDTKSGSINRIMNYVSFLVSSILTGAFAKRHEVVLATSPQMLVGLAGYVLSKVHSAKFVLEIRDLWVDFAEFLGMLNNKTALKYARKLERFLYKKADKIITVTHGYKEHLINLGIDAAKIDVVTNGIDEDFFIPDFEDSSVRKKYGLEEKFIVLYAGNLGAAQGLETVIEAANMLKENKDIVFFLVGEGVERDKLTQMVIEKGLNNVILEGGQTKKDILSFYNSADVSLISLKKHRLFDITLPSKIFDSMAMAKPILIGVGGEGKEIVLTAGAGAYFEPENAESLAEETLGLYRNRKLLPEVGKKARNYALMNFSRKNLADKLEEVLKSVEN